MKGGDESFQSVGTPRTPTATLVDLRPSLADKTEVLTTSRGYSRHRARLTGWNLGVKACAVAVGIVLVANIVGTIFVGSQYGMRNGLHIIHEGSCNRAKRLNLLLHLLINVIGTVLLSASNYCIQGLGSPSRKEVDRAHAKSEWLHIGVLSIRNLRALDRKRLGLCILILLSTLPLHLMFNSTIFSSISANQYSVLTVTADYNSSGNWLGNVDGIGEVESERIRTIQRNFNAYQRLDKDSCIQEYGKQYLAARRNVILVSTVSSTDGKVVLGYSYSTPSWNPFTPRDPFTWICDQTGYSYCDIDAVLRSSNWTVADGKPVDYCMSEIVREQCQVYFNSAVMIVVILCNFLTFVCMCFIAVKCTKPALVTTGDAIASFLESTDLETKEMCLATTGDFSKSHSGLTSPRVWFLRTRYWFQAISLRHLALFCFMAFGSLLTCGLLLMHAINRLAAHGAPTDLPALWAMGFGTVNIFSLVFPEGDYGKAPYVVKSVIGAIILVNLPQLILSLNYFVLNSSITCMMAADEWTRFAIERKALRVTAPTGEQRSTYFLQIPYKFAIPFISVSALLHWLVSQSFFLAKVVALEDGEENAQNSITMFGFSAIAIMFTIATAFLLVFGAICLGLRKYVGSMPLGPSCSAVISAACHPASAPSIIATKQLQWGVVESVEDGYGHCAFTSGRAERLVPGRLYR